MSDDNNAIYISYPKELKAIILQVAFVIAFSVSGLQTLLKIQIYLFLDTVQSE